MHDRFRRTLCMGLGKARLRETKKSLSTCLAFIHCFIFQGSVTGDYPPFPKLRKVRHSSEAIFASSSISGACIQFYSSLYLIRCRSVIAACHGLKSSTSSLLPLPKIFVLSFFIFLRTIPSSSIPIAPEAPGRGWKESGRGAPRGVRGEGWVNMRNLAFHFRVCISHAPGFLFLHLHVSDFHTHVCTVPQNDYSYIRIKVHATTSRWRLHVDAMFE